MKFDKSQDSSWNALVVYVNSQCIVAGSKPQKKLFLFCILSYKIDPKYRTWSEKWTLKLILLLSSSMLHISLEEELDIDSEITGLMFP